MAASWAIFREYASHSPHTTWPFLTKLHRTRIAAAADRKVAALLSIFRRFAAHEAAGGGADAEALAERIVVDPAQLRTALSTSKNFQLGAPRHNASISSACGSVEEKDHVVMQSKQ